MQLYSVTEGSEYFTWSRRGMRKVGVQISLLRNTIHLDKFLHYFHQGLELIWSSRHSCEIAVAC